MAADPSLGSSLTRPASTTAVNPAEVIPFSVNLITPERFDPSHNNYQHKLPIRYEIRDPHERIRSGRITYLVPGPSGDVVVKRTILSAEHWTPGAHVLPDSLCWNGQIEEGLADRRNEFITADLAPFSVKIELWNNSEANPAERVRGGGGRTARSGEWLASSLNNVDIDFVVEARWERPWCIPWQNPARYEDAGDEGKGQVRMTLRVKNVREDTPVRLQILRIENADSVGFPYITSGDDPDKQPGLENLIVQNRRVFSPDSSGDPYVRFNNYAEHWIHPGNNFYYFAASFGELGGFMPASERDYVRQESACLHMRFTVFIHCPPSDEYLAPARALHAFFQGTRYYRSYFLQGKPSDAMNYLRRFTRRYISIHMGHGSAGCLHWDHPFRLRRNTGVGVRTRDRTPLASGTPLTLRRSPLMGNPLPPETIDISTPALNNADAICNSLNALPGIHASVHSTGRGRARRFFVVAIPEEPDLSLQLTDSTGRNVLAAPNFRDPYHQNFDADAYVCPVGHNAPRVGLPIPSHLREHGSRGCGNSSHLYEQLYLGRQNQNRLWASRHPPKEGEFRRLLFFSTTNVNGYDFTPDNAPRLLMWHGGCRGMIGTGMAQLFTTQGSRFFHGWCYSVLIVDNGQFIREFFRRYIAADSSECLIDTFVPIYNRLRRRGQYSRWHPRLYGGSGLIPIAEFTGPGPGEALA